MSSKPASFVVGPATTNTLLRKRYLIIYFVLIWLSSIFPIWLIWTHASGGAYAASPFRFFFLLPFHAIGWYFAWVLGAIIFSKIFLIIVNLIHKPREGYFPRDPKNKDYRFWSLRATIKKFAIWVCHNFPLPWLDIVAFKMFGAKINFNTAVFDAWVDTEFIEIGRNTIVGQGSLLMSSMLTHDYLIIKKIKIGNDCVIGAYSVISPGTIVPDNVSIGALSGTTVDQVLEPNWVYLGVPARKYRKNEYLSMEESDEEMRRKGAQLKQYLTIDEMEEIEEAEKGKERKKKKMEKYTKQYLKELQEQEKELIEAIKTEIDTHEIRRMKRRLIKLQEQIQKVKKKLSEEKKTFSERLRIKTTNIEKLHEKEKSLLEKIAKEKDEDKKAELIERLEKIRKRIEHSKKVYGIEENQLSDEEIGEAELDEKINLEKEDKEEKGINDAQDKKDKDISDDQAEKEKEISEEQDKKDKDISEEQI
ncbi:MAG: hypothetical protein ACTSRZ_10510 [Promethearchaeota archaeon]